MQWMMGHHEKKHPHSVKDPLNVDTLTMSHALQQDTSPDHQHVGKIFDTRSISLTLIPLTGHKEDKHPH